MQATSELLLFVISVLPVFLIGIYIYQKDKHKEPTKLLAKLFLGGIGSCFLAAIIGLIIELIFPAFGIDESKLDLIQLFFKVFFGIALIEEFSKWIMVYKISYKDKEFDEFYDAIVYCVFVALGFACFENLCYVYLNGVGTGILRAFLAVPGHACDGIFMGYYLGLAKDSDLDGNKNLKIKYLILSMVMPTITHGIYDYCVFTRKGLFFLLFLVFIVCMYINVIKKVNKVSSINHKMKYLDNFCPNCGRKVESNFCPKCGRKND